MASNFVLVVATNNDGATTAGEIAVTGIAGNPYTAGAGAFGSVRNISSFIEQELLGRGINIIYTDTSVYATGTVTFTGRPTGGETMLLGNVTITARDSGATGNEFNTSAVSVTTTAASLAALINSSSSFTGIVSATSALGVVTITSSVPGVIGNGIQLSESLSNATFAAFASGAESHRATLSAGL